MRKISQYPPRSLRKISQSSSLGRPETPNGGRSGGRKRAPNRDRGPLGRGRPVYGPRAHMGSRNGIFPADRMVGRRRNRHHSALYDCGRFRGRIRGLLQPLLSRSCGASPAGRGERPMTQALRYAWTAIAILVVSVGLAWPWLDGPGRTGLLTAAGVAFLVQVVAFTLLSAHRAPPNRFLAAWVGGTLVRLGVVIAAGVGISRLPGLPPHDDANRSRRLLFRTAAARACLHQGPDRRAG